MRTVSKLTKEMRRRRAYRLTERWQLAERTRLHEAEQAEARKLDAIAPQWRPFCYVLNKAAELTPAAVAALKTLVREGIVLQAPDTYLEPIDLDAQEEVLF